MNARQIVKTTVVLLIMTILLSQLWFLGQVLRLRYQNPTSSAYMTRAQAQGEIVYQWRDYADISPHLKRAVIAAEDAQFASHPGFDWSGIRYALEQNLAAGKPIAGGSTITQQLAKNLFLSGNRSYLRKGQEALIAAMLELTLSKERILELYLNVAQWGHQIYGAQAAAQRHFQIDAHQLSAHQAAQLAARLPRPNYYDFQGPTDYLAKRTADIEVQLPFVALPGEPPLADVTSTRPVAAPPTRTNDARDTTSTE